MLEDYLLARGDQRNGETDVLAYVPLPPPLPMLLPLPPLPPLPIVLPLPPLPVLAVGGSRAAGFELDDVKLLIQVEMIFQLPPSLNLELCLVGACQVPRRCSVTRPDPRVGSDVSARASI